MADASDREQVDAALALIDDVFATFLIPHDDADPMHAGWTRRASVRADVAQKWRDRRDALAARTPQPAELAAVRAELYEFAPPPWEAINYEVHAGGELLFEALGERSHEENSRIADVVVRFFNAVAPLPAVPDGEDALRQDCAVPDHEWVRCSQCPTTGPCACAGGPCCKRERAEVDGEDVPACLDDDLHDRFVETIGDHYDDGDGERQHALAVDLLAAVAAALARPTGGQG